MKKPKPREVWFFVDESGDPTFYNRKGELILGQSGCSRIFMLGFVETEDPRPIRREVLRLQREVVSDPRFRGIPSISKTAKAFHANEDYHEVRELFYDLISQLDFRAEIIVVRKVEEIFKNRFEGKERVLYDQIASMLLQYALHRYQCNHIYFAKRGDRNRQEPLREAIEFGVREFEAQSGISIDTERHIAAQVPGGEPCLSIIDYVNRAVYRAFTKGEMRYFHMIEDKVSLILDLFDSESGRYKWYHRRNRFDIEKATPL